MRRASVVVEPIAVGDIESLVADSSAGAVVVFRGEVRDSDGGRDVVALEYESHPDAERIIGEVARDVAARHDVVAIAVVHRVGALSIGDSALVAAVSAGHRGEAFAACADLVDETKARLPIWKHQHFVDGTDEWVNSA